MISAPLCSKTITFDGLGVQVGAHVAARFGPIGGQDSKSGGLGGQGRQLTCKSYGTETGRTGTDRSGPERAAAGRKWTQLRTESEPDRYVNDQSYD